MSGLRPFHADDLVVELPSGFVDRTVQLLEWPRKEGKRLVLVIQRETRTPSSRLDALVERDMATFKRELEGFTPKELEPLPDDLELNARRSAFRWLERGEVKESAVLFVAGGDRFLVFHASGPASAAPEVEAIVDRVLETLRFPA